MWQRSCPSGPTRARPPQTPLRAFGRGLAHQCAPCPCCCITRRSNLDKPEKEIQTEIAAIIRQITASVTFLPLLENQCVFDILVYTDSKTEVPGEW